MTLVVILLLIAGLLTFRHGMRRLTGSGARVAATSGLLAEPMLADPFSPPDAADAPGDGQADIEQPDAGQPGASHSLAFFYRALHGPGLCSPR